MMDYLYGIVGFAGFEGLRIYKCLWGNQPVLPLTQRWLYAVTLLTLGAFAGLVSGGMSQGNVGAAIYIGFSVPTSIKAILERPTLKPSEHSAQADSAEVDDIEIESTSLIAYVRDQYLAFR